MVNDDILFGQYLFRFSKRYRNVVTQDMIKKALEIQSQMGESNYTRIGQILMNEFGAFETNSELEKELEELEKFKKKYID